MTAELAVPNHSTNAAGKPGGKLGIVPVKNSSSLAGKRKRAKKIYSLALR
jgi:hypothetical protein